MEASAKEGEGAGRGPCGLRNSELGPLPQEYQKKRYGNISHFFYLCEVEFLIN